MGRSGEPVDAIVLVGGRGTRLQSVISDVPKPLAPVNGRPFLDHQLALLAAAGAVRKVVLATGHLAHRIHQHYAANPPELPLRVVTETELLGTGGGVANALGETCGGRVLVLNGDSFFHWSLPRLEAALDGLGAPGGAALGAVRLDDVSRYGGLELSGGRVSAFREKRVGAGSGLINGGVYLFDRDVLEAIPTGRVVSLELEVFPRLAAEGRLAAAEHDAAFIDIGLPETYAAAASFMASLGEQLDGGARGGLEAFRPPPSKAE